MDGRALNAPRERERERPTLKPNDDAQAEIRARRQSESGVVAERAEC